MLLVELLDRAGQAGAVVILKIGGQRGRLRRRTGVRERGDFERLDLLG